MKALRRIDKSRMGGALSALSKRMDVFAPVPGEDGLRLRELTPGDSVCLLSRKPFLPLKTLFLPGVENIFFYGKGDSGTTLNPAPVLNRDRVIVGALGCDVAGLEMFDRVFLDEFPDEAYRERRHRTTIVAFACTGEGPECFCTSCSVDPLKPGGADAVIMDTGDCYLIEATTEKGRRVLGIIDNWFRDPTEKDRAAASSLTARARDDVPLEKIPTDMDDLWESDLWGELAARCVGCGICTLFCPTCHCYDVQDERRGSTGRRFRVWDSCMFASFTRMASGDNPRPTGRERVRQRFLHKLSYFPANHGRFLCTGCGRCGSYCPAGIGIEEVISRLSGSEVNNG
jgi:ferredoxin